MKKQKGVRIAFGALFVIFLMSAATFVNAADFTTRCQGSGVIKCIGFDSDSEILPTLGPDGNGVIRGSLDTTIKASGAGSLRFEIPGGSSQNSAGHWDQAFGQSFGAGQTFYVQFRQRFSPEMLTANFGGGGWKQVIFHHETATCASLEITTNNQYYRDFPQMYTDCGAQSLNVDLGNGDFLLEQGDYNCHYQGSKPPSECAYYETDKWMTFYYEIEIGSWGQPNSSIKAWIAYEGQPLKQFINITTHRLYQDAPGRGFNYITLLPYDTGKDRRDHSTAYTWYDELIVSTQPISAPTTSPQPPPAPTGLSIN